MLLGKQFYLPKPRSEPRGLEKLSKQSERKETLQQIKFQELALSFYISEA
jgi:hypothetical protein